MSDQGACLTPSQWICDLRSCGYCVAQHPSSSSCSENLTAHSTSEVAHLASHDAKVGPLLSAGECSHLHGRQHLPCHTSLRGFSWWPKVKCTFQHLTFWPGPTTRPRQSVPLQEKNVAPPRLATSAMIQHRSGDGSSQVDNDKKIHIRVDIY